MQDMKPLRHLLWPSLALLTLACSSHSLQRHALAPAPSEARVDALVRSVMTAQHLPGLSLAVIVDGNVVLAKGYGLANVELSVPATALTRFAVFSVTKTFTATAIMMLVEEGRVALDHPMAEYLQDLPATWQPVTIRQLLTHTSGLPEYRDHLPELGDVRPDYPPARVLALIRDAPLQFPAGEGWEYTETNYFLLGLVIAQRSGMPYEDFVTKRLLEPLDLRDTRIDNATRLMPNRADGYLFEADGYVNAPRYSPTLTFAAAGLTSTVLDLAKWDAALGSARLLQPATWQVMWTNATLTSGESAEYGLGFGLTPYRGHRRIGHVGGGDGFSAALSRFVDDHVTVIVCTNLNIGFDISALANDISALYFADTPGDGH